MEKTVYILMTRDRDRFGVLYAGDCEKADDAGFFTQNDLFGGWLKKAGREENLYLAILPLPDSDEAGRSRIIDKIRSEYKLG